MKHLPRYAVIALSAAALSFSVTGCSQNVGVESDLKVTEAPEPSAANSSQASLEIQPPKNKTTPIKWETTYDAALKKARLTQKPIMIDLYADWCPPCKMLDKEIYPSAEVSKEAENFINVKIDIVKNPGLAEKLNPEGGIPTIVFLDASGKEIHRQRGVTANVSDFAELMQTAHAKVAATPA